MEQARSWSKAKASIWYLPETIFKTNEQTDNFHRDFQVKNKLNIELRFFDWLLVSPLFEKLFMTLIKLNKSVLFFSTEASSLRLFQRNE